MIVSGVQVNIPYDTAPFELTLEPFASGKTHGGIEFMNWSEKQTDVKVRFELSRGYIATVNGNEFAVKMHKKYNIFDGMVSAESGHIVIGDGSPPPLVLEPGQSGQLGGINFTSYALQNVTIQVRDGNYVRIEMDDCAVEGDVTPKGNYAIESIFDQVLIYEMKP